MCRRAEMLRRSNSQSTVVNLVYLHPDLIKQLKKVALDEDRTAYEVTEDGGPRLMRSVIYMRSCHGEAIHSTEKPVGLLEILIRTSCPAGGLVGDFFAGSAAVAEACSHAGRDYFGAEIAEDFHAAAIERLRGSLFAEREIA